MWLIKRLFFLFQAEDGIRDLTVTGVQTCALPILGSAVGPAAGGLAANVVGLRAIFLGGGVLLLLATIPVLFVVRESPRRVVRARSEERRVGKECRTRGASYH